MARRKNLLEAFQTKPEASSAPPASPVSSGPRGPLFDAVAARAGGGQPPRWLLVGVGLVISFALGFALGRRTPGETRAAEDAPLVDPRPPLNQPRAFQPPPKAPGAKEAGEAARLEDTALFDARNDWTVVAVAYAKANPASQDYARASYERLRDQHVPVFPPIVSKNTIVVLIGAAPTVNELKDTLSTVQALKFEGKADYASAYCARIDTFIPDRKKGP